MTGVSSTSVDRETAIGSAAVTRQKLKGRSAVTNGKRVFLRPDSGACDRRLRDLLAELARPLGPWASLDEGSRQRVRRAASLSVAAELLEARMARGEQVNPLELVTVANAAERAIAKLKAAAPKPRPGAALDAHLARLARQRAPDEDAA